MQILNNIKSKRNRLGVTKRGAGLWCSWLLASACLLLTPAASAEPLKLATASWPPYIGKDLPKKGMAVDIVTQAFSQAGVETSVVILASWDDVREGVESGVYDVILGYWYSDERARFHSYSDAFMTNRLNFVKRKGSGITYQSLADLEGLMIATVHNYAYGDEFETYPGIYQVKSNHVIQILLTLLEGRADLALGDVNVITHELHSYMPSKLKEIEILPNPLSEKGLHITVSLYNKNGSNILKTFNRQIADMRSKGEIASIIDAHTPGY
ncbi:substrate-binding periplasmic protein [Alkalimarinus alittae]|uniref:Transporter substrate-binding domain-containing protein n=1 Tax=Alkalimarinus alittae TaxID=2961619 RepID=A0ABY6N3S5_9ALTE|nr:transporter substrate-binding domain-containing protein [Alkalimarinus alittae]UZE96773.1 transporter substrate-binding domain-containing protein [Alkalimarinus alittae]